MENPEWFRQAIDSPREDRTVEVAGTPIHYLRWGPGHQPGIILIHGGAAHAHWWAHIAPLLMGDDDYTVAAIDLSGHGDSGHRSEYSLDLWCREVMAVATDAHIEGRPVVIGHSMGGFVSIATGAKHHDEVAGIIVVDSPVRRLDPEEEAARSGKELVNLKVYPDLDSAVTRFRPLPPQDDNEPFVMDYVARRSLRTVDDEGGVMWKFDPNVFDRARRDDAVDLLADVSCRVALLRAEFGLVTQDIGEIMYESLGRVAPVIELPRSGHHPMLDQPLILVTALRTLLADWEHSNALRRAD